MNVPPSKLSRISLLTIGLSSVLAIARAQDVADRIDLAGLLVEDGSHSLIREMIGNRLTGITSYDLVVVAYRHIDDAVCLGVRRRDVPAKESKAGELDDAARTDFEFRYFELGRAKGSSIKEASHKAARDLIAEAWALVEKPKNGIHRANLNGISALHDEVYFYVYCRDPRDPTHYLIGGVLINPIKGTKSELFATKITALISQEWTKPTKVSPSKE